MNLITKKVWLASEVLCTMSDILVISIQILNRRCTHLSPVPSALKDSVLGYSFFALFVALSQ
jgi:hypothetical protein